MEPWKTKFLVSGGLIGAFAGLLAAFLMVKRAETTNTQPKLSGSDGVKIGIGVLGLIKMISDYGNPK